MTELRSARNQCPPGFEPKYRCIEPSDEYAGVLACVSMMVGRPLAEIRQAAVGLVYVPSQMHCPDSRPFAAELLERFGNWTGGGYDHFNPSRKLPDLAIVATAAVTGQEIGGRHCLFHRQRPAPGQPGVEYLVDPYPGLSPGQQTRFDVGAMAFSHFMLAYWAEFSEDF